MSKKSQNSIYESYIDIKVSLRLLKDNWDAFLKTEIFALTAFITFIIVVASFFLTTRVIYPGNRPHPPVIVRQVQVHLPYFVLIFPLLIFYAFISSTYGLSHDIILSGDQFTEFDKSFSYFKRHFFYYTLLSFFILWIPIAIELDFHVRNFFELLPDIHHQGIELIVSAFSIYLIQYLFFVLLNLTLPSITSKGSLFIALKENFNILLNNPVRILFSWGIYFVIFSLPSFLVMFLAIILMQFFLTSFFLPGVLFIVGTIILVLILSSVILGYPIMSLIATRIYATTNTSNSENKQDF